MIFSTRWDGTFITPKHRKCTVLFFYLCINLIAFSVTFNVSLTFINSPCRLSDRQHNAEILADNFP